MRNGILIQELSLSELRELFRGIVLEENEGLRKEVSLLKEELRQGRRVITHRQAVNYFDSRVTPETILEYIWWCGLPASKKGRQWFIQLEDLNDWMLGKIGFESTKPTGIKKIMPPRHVRRTNAASGSDHIRAARHAKNISDHPDSRELGEEKRHL